MPDHTEASKALMRRVTEELHPTLLDNVGLFAALRWQTKHMRLRSSMISASLHLRLRGLE